MTGRKQTYSRGRSQVRVSGAPQKVSRNKRRHTALSLSASALLAGGVIGVSAGTTIADVCIGNTPQKGTIYGIDIRQRSTLRAFRQSIFTNTLAGDHNFADGWTISWVGNYTKSKDDRSVTGEATWDSPSTRNLRPTVTKHDGDKA